ncbi:hypothetical protein ACQKWADRAFT_161472 [Trichoderma austrokoningii]
MRLGAAKQSKSPQILETVVLNLVTLLSWWQIVPSIPRWLDSFRSVSRLPSDAPSPSRFHFLVFSFFIFKTILPIYLSSGCRDKTALRFCQERSPKGKPTRRRWTKEAHNHHHGHFLFAQSHGPLQAQDSWDIKGGYTAWCHDLLCPSLLAMASGDFKKLLGNGVPLFPPFELGGPEKGAMLAPKLLVLRASPSAAALCILGGILI